MGKNAWIGEIVLMTNDQLLLRLRKLYTRAADVRWDCCCVCVFMSGCHDHKVPPV